MGAIRIGYLDCFAGISGDMLLGALVDAGVPLAVLEQATAALSVGASLRVSRVDRSGIACTKVDVLVGSELAEKVSVAARSIEDEFAHQGAGVVRSHQLKTQHLHKSGHADTHSQPEQEHGRPLSVIRELIQGAALDEPVKRTAIRAFELLGAAEAKIHGVPVEQIHFHEVGAVDAIVDIVAASAGIHHLQIGRWFCSALNVGGGMVECAHGTFPVPAPATFELLRGVPTYSAHVQKELVTPTGAALVRALEPEFGPQPAMQVEAIGYGAGGRNPAGFPNVVRLSVGGASDEEQEQTVTVLETALDDLSPQLLAYVAETALAQGALDVMLTPVVMKKGRPGTLLTVLCDEHTRNALQRLILTETSTLGLRIRKDKRACLTRSFVTVETAYGPIRVKVGRLGEDELNVAPEFEDCKAAAKRNGVALKEVQSAANAAYRARGTKH